MPSQIAEGASRLKADEATEHIPKIKQQFSNTSNWLSPVWVKNGWSTGCQEAGLSDLLVYPRHMLSGAEIALIRTLFPLL